LLLLAHESDASLQLLFALLLALLFFVFKLSGRLIFFVAVLNARSIESR
jgi:hypothetical protein